MAQKAKTAEKRDRAPVGKRNCGVCKADLQVVKFVGYGLNGFFRMPEGQECGRPDCPCPERVR